MASASERVFFRRDAGFVVERAQMAVHTHSGSGARLHVQVGPIEVAENLQQSVEFIQVHGAPVYDTEKVKQPISWLDVRAIRQQQGVTETKAPRPER